MKVGCAGKATKVAPMNKKGSLKIEGGFKAAEMKGGHKKGSYKK